MKKTIIIAGPQGSGKTTLTHIITDKKSWIEGRDNLKGTDYKDHLFQRYPFSFDYIIFDDLNLTKEDINELITMKDFRYREPYTTKVFTIQMPDVIICLKQDSFKLKRERENVFIINLNQLK